MGGKSNHPNIFFKPNTAVIGPDDPIVLPRGRNHYEAELAVVIRTLCNVPAEDAKDYIFGYTVANDVSARDAQRKLRSWARKGL